MRLRLRPPARCDVAGLTDTPGTDTDTDTDILRRRVQENGQDSGVFRRPATVVWAGQDHPAVGPCECKGA